MRHLLVLIAILVGQACAQGSPSLTSAIVASIFGTIAVTVLIIVLAFLVYRWWYLPKHRTEKPPASSTGFDNPLVALPAESNRREEDNVTNQNEVAVDSGKTQASPNDNIPIPEMTEQQPDPQSASEDVFTVVLDNKNPVTNGFDVAADSDGDVVVTSVREHGPADKKLAKGDVITSVTVFFDGINYEDALNILSYAAPYKLAITATHKSKDVPVSTGSTNFVVEPISNREPRQAVSPRTRNDGPHSDSDMSSAVSEDIVTDITVKDENVATEARKLSVSSSSTQSSDDASYHIAEESDTIAKTVSDVNASELKKNSTDLTESPVVETVEGQLPAEALEKKVEPVFRSEDETKPSVVSTPQNKPSKNREDIVFSSGWRRAVKLLDLAKARLVSEKTMKKLEFGEVDVKTVANDLKLYLEGEEPIAGLLIQGTGEKLSLYDACQKKIIRRGTAVSLLEAQAATGNMINPYNGAKISVEEAKKQGLIDRQFEAVLVRAERAVLGYKTKLANEPLSLFDAMQRNLVVESHGIRLLEAQIATGGIIDPHANHRLPLDVAFERGLFDKRLHAVLEDSSDDTKGFFDPNTNENLTYLELMQRCIIDQDTSLRLLPFDPEKSKQ